ncbi:MAG: hypothetical protein AAF311_02465 [Pseudomonadota bacterium]
MSFALSARQKTLCKAGALFAGLMAAVPILVFLATGDMISKALSVHETGPEPFTDPWRGLASVLILVEIALKTLLFAAVARLLWILARGEAFTRDAARAALAVGRIQLVLAAAMWLEPTLMRLFRGLGYGRVELSVAMTGPIATALLFGFVLLLLGTIYRSAVDAVEENRQFV